jgi:hypothetical protein
MSEQLILVEGLSASGKSSSLQYIKNPEQILYLNCENKRLPFRPELKNRYNIVDPFQVYEGIDYANNQASISTVIIDTLDFLMNMFETNIIKKAANTQKAWGDYFTYFQELMQVRVAQSSKTFIFLAHASSKRGSSKYRCGEFLHNDCHGEASSASSVDTVLESASQYQ